MNRFILALALAVVFVAALACSAVPPPGAPDAGNHVTDPGVPTRCAPAKI
jgi:hypothetical protein